MSRDSHPDCRAATRAPTLKDWHKTEITRKQLAQYFFGADVNVAVQMGKASGGLTDLDADCEAARRLAPRFMPATGMKFGRASARGSHYEYITNLWETRSEAVLKYEDPLAGDDDERRENGDHAKTILELRIGGAGKAAKTTFPGSIHYKTSELIEFEPDGDGAPSPVDGAGLVRAASLCATACLLSRYLADHTEQGGLGIGSLLASLKATAPEAAQVAEALAPEEAFKEAVARGFASLHFSRGWRIGVQNQLNLFCDQRVTLIRRGLRC